MVMLSATTTEAPRVFMDTMEVMDMVVIMARGLLSQDITWCQLFCPPEPSLLPWILWLRYQPLWQEVC